MKTLIELPPIAEIRFHHLMALNDAVYGAQNGQNYEFTHMSMKVSQFITRATKGIRKGKPDRIRSGLLSDRSSSSAFQR